MFENMSRAEKAGYVLDGVRSDPLLGTPLAQQMDRRLKCEQVVKRLMTQFKLKRPDVIARLEMIRLGFNP